MFNKKLKKRIKSIEEEVGIAYADDYHVLTTDGELNTIKKQIQALIKYLNITDKSDEYGFYDYKKKSGK